MEKNWQKERIDRSKPHQVKAYDEVNELVFKSREGKVVTLVDDTKLIEFVSCSYLGLDLHPKILDSISENIDRYGLTFSAARTRIRAACFDELDDLLGKIFCCAYPTLFSSLHLVHLGVFPLLGSGELPSFPPQENGFNFILDKTCHSSIQINRSMLTQFGKVSLIDFKSTNAVRESAENSIKDKKSPVFIADSVGSMGGYSPIKYLLQLSEEFNGYVYLDDAHGTSVFGKNGCGYVLNELDNSFHSRLIVTASLSKAFGTAGGGVLLLPTREDSEMVRKFSPTYIFGGPVALPIVTASIASAKIHLSEEINFLQDKLRSNILYFDSLVEKKVVNRGSEFPIRGIMVGNEFDAIQSAKLLRENGFAVTVAMYPTVEQKKARLRVALSSLHTKKQIKALCERINDDSTLPMEPAKCCETPPQFN